MNQNRMKHYFCICEVHEAAVCIGEYKLVLCREAKWVDDDALVRSSVVRKCSAVCSVV